ncbi:hypothetical protein RQP46_004224 [Phenoliferia psychrophenolica]
MRGIVSSLAGLAALCAGVSAVPKPQSEHAWTEREEPKNPKLRPKVIIDNDFSGSSSWAPTMLFLYAGYDVLGITVALGNSWVTAESTRILRFLEIANITTIPVYLGATFPLINTAARSNAWQAANGQLAWNGMFNPENATADALGGDPQSGDPFRVTPIPEGLPTFLKAQNQSAVLFMIEQVRKYPGEVEIYAAGGCTNIALAIRLDPEFASLTKKIVYQGAYVGGNFEQTTPTPADSFFPNTDNFADFNSYVDPEAAKIMFSADFPEFIVTGNAANQLFLTPAMIAEVMQVNTTVTTQLAGPYWTTQIGTPLWDELAAALIAFPDIITESRTIYIDIDISYGSPFYGRTIAAVQGFQAPGSRNVTYVTGVNETEFRSLVVKAVQGVYN